ncbi:reverse transcriptase domain-containing protein [Tanacetum coccineum]
MVDSQLVEEEVQGLEPRDVRTEAQKGPTEPVSQTQTTPFPAFVKENIDLLRTMIKEHDQQTKTKATPRKLIYADSERDAPDELMAKSFSDRLSLKSSGTSDTHGKAYSARKRVSPKAKNLHTPEGQGGWKTKAKLRKEPEGRNLKLDEGGSNIKKQVWTLSMRKGVQRKQGSGGSSKHLLSRGRARGVADAHLVQNVSQILGGAARNWFDDLDPKSVDSFEELSHKFLEEFSQQKRYAKGPIEIYGIKRRQSEGVQAFMDRFKSESSHIKGVPPVLRISAFMHGPGH